MREWLHGMSMIKILEVDETGKLYYLPLHHRAGVTSPMVAFGYLLPYLTAQHVKLMEAVTKDGPQGN